MAAMPPESREKAAFIFFDLEETGLLGASGYFKKHKEVMKDKLLVNFDCVSDGENILFVLRKGMEKYTDDFLAAYESDENCKVTVESKGVFYPSDQACFPRGVGVAALNKSKHGVLYMDKIHTRKDTVYREENIDFLVKGSIKLTETISKK
jgi:Zn-dependent M28 family amino/carboxypeptidase